MAVPTNLETIIEHSVYVNCATSRLINARTCLQKSKLLVILIVITVNVEYVCRKERGI